MAKYSPGNISVTDFNYTLPPGRIAQFPLEERDRSRLVIYKASSISETVFRDIHEYIPGNSLLIFNDTRVIRARLIFSKPTGATIEIFCLEPVGPVQEMQAAFQITGKCSWNCLVGNVKRWKEGDLVKSFSDKGIRYILRARRKTTLGDGCFVVEFSWEPRSSMFSEILEKAGLVPLPPYISRATTENDSVRYQTIYASHDGSVAAPTAGLHFTENVMESLRVKGVLFEKVTLHVGIGTFRPVTTPDISGHVMHEEKIMVSRNTIMQILANIGKPILCVGTTSLRTIESLYWLGVKILMKEPGDHPSVDQWDAYDPLYNCHILPEKALSALIDYLSGNRLEHYSGSTQIMIIPGYEFKLAKGLITNFHLPQSTLLLLIAAFIGNEWKKVYQYALENKFRFLSYGDACLFLP